MGKQKTDGTIQTHPSGTAVRPSSPAFLIVAPNNINLKKKILLAAALSILSTGLFAQLTFVHISDMHVSSVPFMDSDTNAQYFRCSLQEFALLNPKPAFVVVSGDVSNVGNQTPDGMYPVATQYLFPTGLINPGIGDYFIDAAQTIPIYFVPGNHDYWEALVNPPVSNDTIAHYEHYVTPDSDYAVTTNLAVLVFLRSGSDSTITAQDKKGKGLTDAQCNFLRNTLSMNSDKRKIIIMHHPGVNAVGTNSDGTPYTGVITGPDYCSIANNRNTFLNICDSNHVDLVLSGHEHQNVVANRSGHVIPENGADSTRYIQTAAAFNGSYRIITVDSAYVTVSNPLLACTHIGIRNQNEPFAMSVFPNPATNLVTIGFAGQAEIEILNFEGQTLKKMTAATHFVNIDIRDFSSGMYIIKATSSAGIVFRKLIKQ